MLGVAGLGCFALPWVCSRGGVENEVSQGQNCVGGGFFLCSCSCRRGILKACCLCASIFLVQSAVSIQDQGKGVGNVSKVKK